MAEFEMHNATENTMHPEGMDVYAIYLRKSRADAEAQKKNGI